MTTSIPTESRATRGTVAPSHAAPRTGRTSPGTAWLRHPLSDAYLIGVTSAMLLVLGTVMIWSASSVFAYNKFKGDSLYFIKRQVIWVVLALVVVLIAQRIKLDVLKRLGWLMFGVCGALMVLTFVPGIRYCVNGNCNWINFSSESMLRLQPSEIAKIVIVVWGAAIFTSKRRLLHDSRHLLVPFLPGSLLLVGLTLLQKDLGTALILLAITGAMLWFVGAPWRVLVSVAAVAVLGAVVMALTQHGRLERILGFLDPTADPTGTNYQPNQAQYGLAIGGWWGVGLGQSRMKWGFLSEAHTDYILAIIGEELGLVGTLACLTLLLLLSYAGFRTAVRSRTHFGRLVAAGVTTWLSVQALINVCVVLRMLPVLGVPLPLVSYGGSSLVMNVAAIGVLVRCALEEPKAQEFLALQKKSKVPRARPSAVVGVRRRG